MSAWGKYDRKYCSGTVTISFNGTVDGTGTAFTEDFAVGDFIRTADKSEYIVTFIEDDTLAYVINANPELGDLVEQTDSTFYASEKPTSIASDPNTLSTDVYNVDRYEIHGDQHGGYVSAVGIIQGGTGYTETPAVTFQNGGGAGASAQATVTDGVVTAITVTNNGSGYETAPDIFINIPYRTIPTSGVNASTDTITYNNHGITAGDRVHYYQNGGTAMAGVSNDTTYYAGQVTTNTFKLYNSAARGATAIADKVIATSAVNTTANTITISNHGLVNGAQMNYNNQGGSSIGGLTSGNDYFVIVVDASTIKLEDTVGGGAKDLTTTGNNSQTLASTGRINITGTGNNGQYFDLLDETTATAAAALGVSQGDATGDAGAVAHTGWVKRKVLAGQHAGRIQYEVLVAQSKNAGVSDAPDDIEFPED